MKKQIIFTILGILLLISLVSAIEIIAGNNYTFEIETNIPLTWTVVGNSSNMDGFSVYQDEYNITFVTDYRFSSDNFTIILFDNSTKEIIKEVHHYSSGGTKTVYKDKNNTIYKDKIIEVEKIVNQTTFQDCPTCEPEKDWFWNTLGILIIILLFILIARNIKKNRKN